MNPDDAKFQALLQAHNYTPPQTSTGGWYDKLTKSTQTPSSTPLGDIGAAFHEGVGKIGEGIQEAKPVGGGGVPGLVEGVGKILGGATEAATSPLAPAMKPVGSAIETATAPISANPEIQKFAMSPAGEMTSKVAETVLNYDEAAGLIAGLKVAPEVKASLTDILQKAKSSITPEATVAETPKIAAATGEDLQSIADKITPKPTVAEAKTAMAEGRLFKGSEPTLFKAGTADKVAYTTQQANSARTIARVLPNAAKMDEPTLYSALDEKIGETAQKLQPEMVNTPISPETIAKINEDWTNLKKTQITEAKATDEPNVVKWQGNFEKFLQKSGAANFNDLWETAKAYDASIKANVKAATDLSPEDLQTQKGIWLQNRQILRSAINDSVQGLGKTSQQAFGDMRDMYEAQNGLLSKAKIETDTAPSKAATLKKTIHEHPYVATGLGLLGAYETAKALTGN